MRLSTTERIKPAQTYPDMSATGNVDPASIGADPTLECPDAIAAVVLCQSFRSSRSSIVAAEAVWTTRRAARLAFDREE